MTDGPIIEPTWMDGPVNWRVGKLGAHIVHALRELNGCANARALSGVLAECIRAHLTPDEIRFFFVALSQAASPDDRADLGAGLERAKIRASARARAPMKPLKPWQAEYTEILGKRRAGEAAPIFYTRKFLAERPGG